MEVFSRTSLWIPCESRRGNNNKADVLCYILRCTLSCLFIYSYLQQRSGRASRYKVNTQVTLIFLLIPLHYIGGYNFDTFLKQRCYIRFGRVASEIEMHYHPQKEFYDFTREWPLLALSCVTWDLVINSHRLLSKLNKSITLTIGL